jgi:GntR family transcriptional regulator
MPTTQRNGLPAYQQIQLAILKRIESGHLKPGDAVDSERDLARIHRVSLMTARHALAVLEREGVVRRQRGSGTFVSPPKIHFNKLMSFSEQMSGRSLVPCSRVLSFGVVDQLPEVAARLALSGRAPLIRFERLRLGGDEPFALETCYLSAQDFAGLSRSALEHGSLFSILEKSYDTRLAHADEEIDATAADPQTAHLLAIQRGMPVLRIRQVIYSTQGKPVVYVLGLYRSDRHNLMVRRYR